MTDILGSSQSRIYYSIICMKHGKTLFTNLHWISYDLFFLNRLRHMLGLIMLGKNPKYVGKILLPNHFPI